MVFLLRLKVELLLFTISTRLKKKLFRAFEMFIPLCRSESGSFVFQIVFCMRLIDIRAFFFGCCWYYVGSKLRGEGDLLQRLWAPSQKHERLFLDGGESKCSHLLLHASDDGSRLLSLSQEKERERERLPLMVWT